MTKKTKPEVLLANKIRTTKQYISWKNKILQRDAVTYPKIPKNIQVHHITPLLDIIRNNNIQTIDEALLCKEIWDINNGVAVTKGEHMIISNMEWFCRKKISHGFVDFLKHFIEKNKEKVVKL